MARTWADAQKREKDFWRKIYVDRAPDIPTYRPVTDAAALDFTDKSLRRFGLSLCDLYGETIADIGCGPYGIIKGIQLHQDTVGKGPARIYGVDPLIEEYRRYNLIRQDSVTALIGAKSEAIPIPATSCRYVFSINVIDHVEDPPTALQECMRICAHGGSVNVALHVVRPPWSLLRRWLKYIDRNHPHHFSRSDVLRLMGRISGAPVLHSVVPVINDQPDYALLKAITAPQKLRGLKRWFATIVFEMIYIHCEHTSETPNGLRFKPLGDHHSPRNLKT